MTELGVPASFRTFVRGSLVLLFIAVSAGAATAQDADAVLDPYPLRPADTSSPRDTLRSFLANVNEAILDSRRGESGAKSDRNYLRAVDALDLSTTPGSDSWSVQTARVAYLKEILDRIEVPPDAEIPGDGEVADGAITVWTLPNTRIRIRRIEEGPRAGEFLFSADTVERLDRLYRHAKHLPYKPGAVIGVDQDLVGAPRAAGPVGPNVRNRLEPVDTSNPRSTLQGFLESVGSAYGLVMETGAALNAVPPTMSREQGLEAEAMANIQMHRAMATLDLSGVPEALREDVGVETVLQLKEILDRLLLPPVDSIPDARAVASARDRTSWSASQAAGPLRWRYPDTEIEIVQITEGERQGQFLFSPGTVRRVDEFYERVQDLPYRTDRHSGAIAGEYESAATTEGFYDYYISTPGYLIPGLTYFGTWLDELPSWFKTLHGRQTTWQWIALLLCVVAVGLTSFLVFRVAGRLAAWLEPPRDGWLVLLAPAIVAILVVAVVDFLDNDLNITGSVLAVVTAGGRAIVVAMATWAVFGFCTAVAETLIASPRMKDREMDASLWRIGSRIVGFMIGAWIVVDAVRALGADVVPLVAGLGVGGLAVALAAQTTLANFIGSLILYANKPVRVGDLCQYGDDIGTVEEIGLHSTRIRTLERSIVTVPNAEFSQMQLDNFGMRDQRLFKTVLQLRYETTPEQMIHLLAQLRELLLAHPRVAADPARVRFVGFGPYSKDVEVFAYLRCVDQATFLAIQEDLLLRIENVITKGGSGFAFPSQTAYLAQDTGIDTERAGPPESKA